MPDDTTLPILTRPARLPLPIEQLAPIPEEEIWLQKQKSARTRRAYRLDVQHFMPTLGITMPAKLRRGRPLGDDRYMHEVKHAAASTIRRAWRRCPLYKHLVRPD